MKFEQNTIEKKYNKIAGAYSWIFPLTAIGLEARVRKMTLEAMQLKKGQVVLDVGCGTGRNFPMIMDMIGPDGYLIGVDYSGAMLKEAQKLVEKNQWKNVQLIECDAAKLDLKKQVDVAVSTLAVAVIPDYKEALRRMVAHVKPGGNVVIAECKLSERVPWLNKIARRTSRIFGAEIDRQAWVDFSKLVDDFTCYDAGPVGLYFIASGHARENK